MGEPFIIDGWHVQPDLNSLSRGPAIVRLEPKVMEVCVTLARARGAVVSKAELLESVWPDAVVGEDALTRAISELRRALEDDARHPRVIETIPKRGYRLLVDVQAVVAAVEPSTAPSPGAPSWHRHAWALPVAGVLIAGATWLAFARGQAPAAVATQPPLRRFVLVADVQHVSGVPSTLIETVKNAVEREVARRADLGLVSRQQIDAALRRMRRAASEPVTQSVTLELAARLGGVAAIVFPRLDRAGGEFALTIQTMDPVGGQVIDADVARGSDERQLLTAVERESDAWLTRVTSLEPGGRSPLPAVTTSSLVALRFFARAMDLLEDVPMAPQAAPWSDAATFLQQALDEDPHFVSAKIWLALAFKSSEDARLSARGGRRAALDMHRQMALDCLAQAQTVGEAERLFLEGVAYGLLDERHKAMAALETVLSTDREFFELQTRAMLYRLYVFESRSNDADAQVLRIAELAPDDFDATVLAAQVLVLQDGDARRAAPYIAKARHLLTPAIATRENSAWTMAWLEHYPAYDAWKQRDFAEVLTVQRRLAATLSTRVAIDRNAVATANGHMWLTLGRVAEARNAFEAIGHFSQKEWSFAFLADVLGDRRQQVFHLTRHSEWSWNPLPFARAGLFDRMRPLLKEPAVSSDGVALREASLGEEALARGRPSDAITHFQTALNRMRLRPGHPYYQTSTSLARAWRALGDDTQVIRVLEEAVRVDAHPWAAALWIKAQVYLAYEYRRAGRLTEAEAVAARVRQLLAEADPDHPFLRALDHPADPFTSGF